MPNWTDLLKQSPMIVNHFKGKIERARQEKRNKGLPDELTKDDLQPIMESALNMVRSNVPKSNMRPENIEEMGIVLKKSGIGGEFGLRDSEIDLMAGIAKEQLGQPVIAPMPMPQGFQNLPPELKQLLMKQNPQTGGMR